MKGWVAALASTGVAFAVATTAWRMTKCGIRQVLVFALLWPLVLCYLLSFAAGYAAGGYGKGEES